MDLESNTAVKVLRVAGGIIIALVMMTYAVLNTVEYIKSGGLDVFIIFVIVSILFTAELVLDAASALSERFCESFEEMEKRRPALALLELITLLFSLPVCAVGNFLALIPLLGYAACFVMNTTPDKLGSAAGIIIVGIPLLLTIVGLIDIMLMIRRQGKIIKKKRRKSKKK